MTPTPEHLAAAEARFEIHGWQEAVKTVEAQRDTAREERDEARAEVERLRAIVDRLPKTADGVPVVPGMNLYFKDGPKVYASFAAWHEEGERCWGNDPWDFHADRAYSTRSAALAALEAGK